MNECSQRRTISNFKRMFFLLFILIFKGYVGVRESKLVFVFDDALGDLEIIFVVGTLFYP